MLAANINDIFITVLMCPSKQNKLRLVFRNSEVPASCKNVLGAHSQC